MAIDHNGESGVLFGHRWQGTGFWLVVVLLLVAVQHILNLSTVDN
jgi:hypothetical protein